jgi:hypothetical protein
VVGFGWAQHLRGVARLPPPNSRRTLRAKALAYSEQCR